VILSCRNVAYALLFRAGYPPGVQASLRMKAAILHASAMLLAKRLAGQRAGMTFLRFTTASHAAAKNRRT